MRHGTKIRRFLITDLLLFTFYPGVFCGQYVNEVIIRITRGRCINVQVCYGRQITSDFYYLYNVDTS